MPISRRPAEADGRDVAGHWEGDLRLGRGASQIATVVERPTRYTVLVHVEGRDMASVTAGLSRDLTRLPEQLRKSLTWDRGMELADYKSVTTNTGLAVWTLKAACADISLARRTGRRGSDGPPSLKTGGCPEDCHFCSQSGQFSSPVRSVWLKIPELVAAAKETRATGGSEFCIVAAVRRPDERLVAQVRKGIEAIKAEVDINIACSLAMLTREQVDQLRDRGVHRYNHNSRPRARTSATW